MFTSKDPNGDHESMKTKNPKPKAADFLFINRLEKNCAPEQSGKWFRAPVGFIFYKEY
jgi:hypothetical protein